MTLCRITTHQKATASGSSASQLLTPQPLAARVGVHRRCRRITHRRPNTYGETGPVHNAMSLTQLIYIGGAEEGQQQPAAPLASGRHAQHPRGGALLQIPGARLRLCSLSSPNGTSLFGETLGDQKAVGLSVLSSRGALRAWHEHIEWTPVPPPRRCGVPLDRKIPPVSAPPGEHGWWHVQLQHGRPALVIGSEGWEMGRSGMSGEQGQSPGSI